MRILSLSLLALPFFIACGGPSDSTKITELSDEEAKDLCEEAIDSNPERTVTCMGVMITVGLTSADCADPMEPNPSCTATVGDARACNEAQGDQTEAQICAGDFPAACAKIVQCSGGDDGPQ
jgi:hypothetical protein